MHKTVSLDVGAGIFERSRDSSRLFFFDSRRFFDFFIFIEFIRSSYISYVWCNFVLTMVLGSYKTYQSIATVVDAF